MNSIKTYHSIDLIKFIFSLLLLGFHLIPTFGFNDFEFYYGEWLCRICVPFFFISTGYFLSKANWNKVKRYLLKIIKYYIVATIIYLPFNLSSYETIQDFAQAFFIDGTHFHLWYFPALIYGTLLSFLIRKLNHKLQYTIIFCFLIFGIFFNEHYKLFLDLYPNLESYHYLLSSYGTTRNGIFFAFPLITVGRLINNDNNLKKDYILLILFSILYFVEVSFLRKYIPYVYLDLSIFGFFAPYYLFKICLIKNINIDDRLSIFFRKSSTIIYIIHPITLSIVNRLPIYNIFMKFIFCSALCLVLCYFYINVIEKRLKITQTKS